MAYNDEMIKNCVDLFTAVTELAEKYGSDSLAYKFNMFTPFYFISQGKSTDFSRGIYMDGSNPDRHIVGFVDHSRLTPVAYMYRKDSLSFHAPNQVNLPAGLANLQALHDELKQYLKLEAQP